MVPDFPDFNDGTKLGSGKEMVDRLTNLIAIFENPALDFSRNRGMVSQKTTAPPAMQEQAGALTRHLTAQVQLGIIVPHMRRNYSDGS